MGVLFAARIGIRYGKSLWSSLEHVQTNDAYEYISITDPRISIYGFPSDIPIVLLSRISGGYSIDMEESAQRDAVIRETYERALANGDENIFFIDGCNISLGKADMLVDGKHPNDYGMRIIADEIIQYLEQSLIQNIRSDF